MKITRNLPAAVLLALAATPAFTRAATTRVTSLDALQAAINAAHPGDHIVLADGSYAGRNPVLINKPGTADRPLVIESESVGGATITGDANFRFETPAAYVVLKGFVFANHAGNLSLPAGVHHCRITRNVFALKVNKDERSTFLDVFGDDNEIDHNTFRDKETEGQMLFVEGPTGDTCAKRTWIHHNAFLDFKNAHKNNASGLHIGSSGRSMDSAFSVVEQNLFVRNNGENEGAICNKSCDNIYRYNTIRDSRELSLRHGHRVEVYGNVLLDSDGLRFFAHDHQIHGNYFEHCQTAVAIGNGDGLIPPAALTAHQRPERVKITYNTFVDNRANLQLGGRAKNGLGATDITIAHNLIVGGPKALTIAGPFDNPTLKGNILSNTTPGDLPEDAFSTADPKLAKSDNGLLLPATGLPAGASADPGGAPELHPLTESEVGPKSPDDVNRPLLSSPAGVHWLKE